MSLSNIFTFKRYNYGRCMDRIDPRMLSSPSIFRAWRSSWKNNRVADMNFIIDGYPTTYYTIISKGSEIPTNLYFRYPLYQRQHAFYVSEMSMFATFRYVNVRQNTTVPTEL